MSLHSVLQSVARSQRADLLNLFPTKLILFTVLECKHVTTTNILKFIIDQTSWQCCNWMDFSSAEIKIYMHPSQRKKLLFGLFAVDNFSTNITWNVWLHACKYSDTPVTLKQEKNMEKCYTIYYIKYILIYNLKDICQPKINNIQWIYYNLVIANLCSVSTLWERTVA